MKHLLCVVNPVSGHKHGTRILREVLPFFSKSGIQLKTVITQAKGWATELMRSTSLDDFDALVVVGGDGTYHEVVNGIMLRKDGRRLPVGLIPAGTGNSLAHDLDLLDVIDATEAIINEKTMPMDLIEIRHQQGFLYAFNIIGWGLPTDANLLAERMRWLGRRRYDLAALFEIVRNRRRRLKITFDGKVLDKEMSIVLACNTKYTGKGMKMAPLAVLNDGKIDLLLVKKLSRTELIRLFQKVFSGTHVPHPMVEYHQVSSYQLDSEEDMPLNVDGEITGSTPCKVRVLPAAVEIFIK